MRQAYVGFGANLGDPASTLQAAAAELGRTAGTVTAGSHIYRSRPIGLTDQPDFQNAVARVSTALAPEALLDELLSLEARFGRVREVRFGPRTLDLDLLWYEGVVRDDERLTLPHPRAHEREFVLRPLAELDPDLEIRGTSVAGWLARLDPQGVEPTGVPLM
ncbi:MAG TPA: 2-amino-4-hydroxy-6-hydroxymethyldihydropteridine diphosphokinase [Gaiellales bacterium]